MEANELKLSTSELAAWRHWERNQLKDLNTTNEYQAMTVGGYRFHVASDAKINAANAKDAAEMVGYRQLLFAVKRLEQRIDELEKKGAE